jgi:hypothetical protein
VRFNQNDAIEKSFVDVFMAKERDVLANMLY